MKKVLTIVAAAALALGVAATASALDFSVTGYYAIDGWNISDKANMAQSITGGMRGVAVQTPSATSTFGPVETGTNDWIEHDFRMYPKLKVNDNISMNAEIRLLSDTLFTGGTAINSGGNAGADVDVNKLYMTYKSPIGKWVIGNMSNNWGTPFLNSSGSASRVVYVPNMIATPWSAKFVYQKTEADGGPQTAAAVAAFSPTVASDLDSDGYLFHVGYKGDGFSLALADWYQRRPVAGLGMADMHQIRFMGTGKIGPVNIATEITKNMGDHNSASVVNGINAMNDQDGASGMLLLTGKATDNLTIGGIYFYSEAEDTDPRNMSQGQTSLGNDFQPTYIMTGDGTGLLNAEDTGNAILMGTGVHGYGVFADYTASDKMTIHVCLAAGKADDTASAPIGTFPLQTTTIDDDYGWEFDLGMSYKLLDNLTYDLHFGYLELGDFAKLGNPAADSAEVTLLSHHLKMKF